MRNAAVAVGIALTIAGLVMMKHELAGFGTVPPFEPSMAMAEQRLCRTLDRDVPQHGVVPVEDVIWSSTPFGWGQRIFECERRRCCYTGFASVSRTDEGTRVSHLDPSGRRIEPRPWYGRKHGLIGGPQHPSE